MLAATVIPLLLLAGLELSLRLAGYGYSPHFFQRVKIQQVDSFADNPKFNYRFFPPRMARIATPVTMPARKPAGTIRILVFGESAALGDPRPAFGAARYMEALLRAKYPQQPFEVVNTSMTAINSHVIREIAEDCIDKEGDIWLVYMGNNEMVGPFGAATVFGPQAPPLWLTRLTIEIQEWRTGQLLMNLGRKLKTGDSTTAQWHGMEMFLRNLVAPDDPRRRKVHEAYRRNLDAIIKSGRAAGAKLILSTVAVNTRDCPPFAGVATNQFPLEARAQLESALVKAAAAEEGRDWTAATNEYAGALRSFPNVAELHYRMGEALLHCNAPLGARISFEMARDLDALPFRADSVINERVAIAGSPAGKGSVQHCDAAAELGKVSGLGPGAESFFEHVHLNFDGNYRLGLAWAKSVETLLPSAMTNGSPWAAQSECEAALGLTDWNRRSVVQEVLDRLEQPPLSTQSNNGERSERLKEWLARLNRSIQSASPTDARAMYQAAIARAPADYRLHENFAEFLEDTGDGNGAISERRAVRDLTPHYYFSHYILGKLLKQQKQFAEARECLLKAAALKPDQTDVLMELGNVYALEGKWEQSLAEFTHALTIAPDNFRLHQLSADVLWRLERRPEAIASLQRTLAIRPDHVEARYRLGEMLALSGDVAGAAQEFTEVLRLRPTHLKARLNLGVALTRLGRTADAIREFDEVLKQDPGNPVANQAREAAEQTARTSRAH